MKVRLKLLKAGIGLPLPEYATTGSSGCDLHAAIDDTMVLLPNTYITVGCGIAIALPRGYEGQIRSRSGLASERGVVVLNAPGTIDCDYRGEIKVILMNHGSRPFEIRRGDRIAQIVFCRVARGDFSLCDELDVTARGLNGFGSSGTS